MFTAKLMHSDGVLQRLHTRLQAEGNLGVTHRVSAQRRGGTESEGRSKAVQRVQQIAQINHGSPLPINRAQRYTPELRAELGQLRNVISYLNK